MHVVTADNTVGKKGFNAI